MRLRRLVLALLCSLPAALPAEILLEAPADGETITTTAPALRAFLDLSGPERRACFNDPARRRALHAVRDAQPCRFAWTCTAGETGTFRVVVSEQPDFSTPSPALALPTRADRPHEARLANFLIGRTYFWKVVCTLPGGGEVTSRSGRFQTDPRPPRLLVIPQLGNVRDLGGRPGLGGRMIRQGMIFRSSGLNQNSPDRDPERKDADKRDPKSFRIGATKLTPDGAAYLTRVLGCRTDLDLRGPTEVGSMTASPAGPGVRWINHASSAYGDIFGPDGSCTGAGPEAMRDNFRVFCDRANYPIVVHCIGGADRTGALAYVLNGVLGVDGDELARDWEITAHDYFTYEKMFDDLARGFDRFGAPGEPLSRKIEAYLRRIGVTPEEIAGFRAIMLEG